MPRRRDRGHACFRPMGRKSVTTGLSRAGTMPSTKSLSSDWRTEGNRTKAPNTKQLQRNTKVQAPKRGERGFEVLGFGSSVELGAWNLVVRLLCFRHVMILSRLSAK